MENSRESPGKSGEDRFGTYVLYSGLAIVLVVIAIWMLSQLFGLTAAHHNALHNSFYVNMAAIFSVLNILLLGYLLAKYMEVYFETKTEFTLGLILLIVAMLAHSITSNPLFYFNLGFGAMTGPFAFIPVIFTTVASLTLVYLVKQ